MAPAATVDEVMNLLGRRSGGGYGIVALVGLFVLGIVCIALCMGRKKATNAYDVNGSKSDGANGASTTRTDDSDYSWRSHNNMPPSTLQRSKTPTH